MARSWMAKEVPGSAEKEADARGTACGQEKDRDRRGQCMPLPHRKILYQGAWGEAVPRALGLTCRRRGPHESAEKLEFPEVTPMTRPPGI